jgi:dolichol kinase
MCDNQSMAPSLGYNRTARKLLHIAGGLGALTLPFVPYWLALAAALAALVLALLLKPKHAWWLRVLAKPRDRLRGVITGMRGYCFVVLLLILLWPLLNLGFDDAAHFVMFGWLAMALGDGAAGLVGPHPSKARTVPWNKRKTWWGALACLLATLLAYYVCFVVPWPAVEVQTIGAALGPALLIAIVVTALESLETAVDDNYLVGLGAVLCAAALRLVLG